MHIKVLLVDDHKIMRHGIRSLLEKQAGMEVLEETNNGRTAIELARTLSPDVIVMDGCPLLNMTAFAALYRQEHFNEDFCRKAVTLMSSGGDGLEKRDPLFQQFPEMTYLRRLGFDRLSVPDVVFFLDVEPDEAIRRIDSRGEEKQAHETKGKLSRLREAYLLVCAAVERERLASVLRIDGSGPLTDVTSQALEFVRQARNGHASR